MTLASTRPLAASLAALLALAPLYAAASPYAVLAPAVPEDSPAAEGSPAAPPVSEAAESAAATSPTEPLSDDPALEYRRGEQAYALGNYEQAVRHFERSYQLSNFADLLYNLGMAYAQWFGLDGDVGHLRKARRLFQNYTKRLAENPEMDQSQRDEAEAQVARIDEQIAEQEQRAAPPPVVKPQPQPQPQPLPDQPEKKPVYRRGWFWGVIGVVVVGAAVTTAVVLTRKPGFEPELGTIGPNSSAAMLRF